MSTRAIFTGAFILFVGNILSSVLGLTREVLNAAYYGANVDMDSYLFANTIPSFILTFIGGVFMAGFIPLFIKKRVEHSAEEASYMFSNSINVILIVVILLTGLCYWFSGPLASFFASDSANQEQIQKLLWILLPSILFFGLSYSQSAVLNSLNHFTIPAFLTVMNNVVVIVFMIVLNRWIGITSIAIGFVVGTVLQVIVQWPMMKRLGVRYKLYLNFKDKDLKKLLVLAIPIIGIGVIDQCLVLATRFFSSNLSPGSASALNYANRIIMLPVTLFGTALVSAIYPSVVRALAEKNIREYNTMVSTSVKSLLLLVTPVMLICMAFAPNIINALLERGAFDQAATHKTAISFMILSLGIMVIPIREFFTRLMFGQENIRTPLIASCIYLSTFIAGCILLVPSLQYIGIAVATSVAMVISFMFTLFTYVRKNKNHKVDISVVYLLKIFISSVLATLIALSIREGALRLLNMEGTNVLITVFCLVTGMVFYFIIVKLLRIQEVEFVFNKLSAKFHWKRSSGTVKANG
ncbi:murein biosynthesis integral membrane protein MurJ [Cohnella herbarum]|uniref:Lipid II flippase n=1 Tax=Cohnella herbarum TaxID=2728023 RepID=A0A7Z2VQ64_9BACL|nr:murein biosynthesis integral membrane protein MurJ [Cohnella herbarum]QJD87204.1 murein biosynthesis integral membrane protein MurJ [Cohnella herbarum]